MVGKERFAEMPKYGTEVEHKTGERGQDGEIREKRGTEDRGGR